MATQAVWHASASLTLVGVSGMHRTLYYTMGSNSDDSFDQGSYMKTSEQNQWI